MKHSHEQDAAMADVPVSTRRELVHKALAGGALATAGVALFSGQEAGAATTLQWVDRSAFASLNAAIASIASIGVVYIPAGAWTENVRAVIPSNKTITIIGDGIGRSVLTWNVANGGIQFNGPVAVVQNVATAVVRDLTLVTSVAGGGTALEIDAGNDGNGYYGNAYVNSVEIRSSVAGNGSPYWTNGLVLKNCWYPIVSGLWVTGSVNTTNMTAAVKITGRTVNAQLTGVNVSSANFGLLVEDSGDSTEGVTLHQAKFVLVNHGVYAETLGGAIAGLAISGIHVDSYLSGVRLWKRHQASIANSHFLKRDSASPYLGIQAVLSDDCHVNNCTFNVINGGLASDNGLIFSACQRGTATGNSFTGFDTSIWIKSDSSRCVAVGNSSQGGGVGTTAWLNQSTTSNMDTGAVGLNPWNV
jgi:hypothetical protein